MTRKQRVQAWGKYVRMIASMLALKDWTLVLSCDRPDDGNATAAIYAVPGRKRAYLYLSDGFLEDDDPVDQRHSIVHELVHCHVASYSHSTEAKFQTLAGTGKQDHVLDL
jgi:hypothetical protein